MGKKRLNGSSDNKAKKYKRIKKYLGYSTIGILSIINLRYEFVTPQIFSILICLSLLFLLLLSNKITKIILCFISYKKDQVYKQEQTKQVKAYLKYQERVLKEKEKLNEGELKFQLNLICGRMIHHMIVRSMR